MLRPAAVLLALALVGGVAASDALQYHGSNLAPTARYEELASLDSRFAGRGPALFTDYDEYSLYLLRNLDVGGPGFMFPPRGIVQPSGQPVDLDLITPGGTALLPADRHASRPFLRTTTGRLPPAVAGRLLPGVDPAARRSRGARARQPRRARVRFHASAWPASRAWPSHTAPSSSAQARRDRWDRRGERLASCLA